MIDGALKELIKQAVREVLEEGSGPLLPIENVARMIGCKDVRTARVALATRGIPVEQIGRGYFVNREHIEAIGSLRRRDKVA